MDAKQLKETYKSEAFFYYSREDVNLLLIYQVQRIDQVSTLIHKSLASDTVSEHLLNLCIQDAFS